MSIETLEDIAEEMADAIGVYGGCDDRPECGGRNCCRSWFVASLQQRMRFAADVERIMDNEAHPISNQ